MAIIEAQNVTKMLNGRTILNGVSFKVEEGDIFGFLGPSKFRLIVKEVVK